MLHSTIDYDSDKTQYLTFAVCKELFGLDINKVEGVFPSPNITRVPLARSEIAGILNWRGRVITAIDMHKLLNTANTDNNKTAISFSCAMDGCYCLLVDTVYSVLTLPKSTFVQNPTNLTDSLRLISTGMHKTKKQPIFVIDTIQLLNKLYTKPHE